jgi:hypothetical protein
MTALRRTFAHACTHAATLALLGGCVAPTGPTTAAADGARLLLRVADPAASGPAVARLVSDAAGAPVDHIAASGGGWHAVLVRCTGSACDTAIARLRRSTERPGPIQAVEIDARKRPA